MDAQTYVDIEKLTVCETQKQVKSKGRDSADKSDVNTKGVYKTRSGRTAGTWRKFQE